MKTFFSRNINFKGRLLRGIVAVALLAGAAFSFGVSLWLAITLLVSGVFVGFEALRGWCALRACGIKTRL